MDFRFVLGRSASAKSVQNAPLLSLSAPRQWVGHRNAENPESKSKIVARAMPGSHVVRKRYSRLRQERMDCGNNRQGYARSAWSVEMVARVMPGAHGVRKW